MSTETPEKKLGPAGGNLFIKNLDKSIDDNGLQDLFSKFGVILSCKVAVDDKGASKGHGFIQFENEESAKEAIHNRNGKTLRDKKMFVGIFIPRNQRDKSQGETTSPSTSGQMPPMPPTASPGINYRPVGIFWDIENCSVPKNKSACALIAHIRNAFVLNRLNHREYEFMIACDITRVRKDIPDDVKKAGGVTLAHVSGASKNAADEQLRDSMKRFVDTHNTSSPMLVLISSDIDFVNDLRGYQGRIGCRIVLIHDVNCSSQFTMGWNETYSFQDFCSAVPNVVIPSNVPKSNARAGNGNKQPRNMNNGILGPRPEGPPGQQVQRKLAPYNAQFHPIPNRDQFVVNGTQHGQFQQPLKSLLDFTVAPPTLPMHNQQNSGRSSNHRGQSRGPPGGQQQQRVSAPPIGQMRQMNIQEPTTKGEFIIMVAGLPGKMDFHILKDHLQEQANVVNGKVKYLKNGQGFISFTNKSNAERAVQFFHGKEVYGNILNVSSVQSIPFEKQRKSDPVTTAQGRKPSQD